MKATFVGNPRDPDDEQKVCEMAGVTFFRGIATEIGMLPADVQRRIANNSHFVVDGELPTVKAPGKRGRKPRSAPVETEPDDWDTDSGE